MAKKQGRFVMVTTEKRGVFAGVLEKQEGDTVVLTEARMAVYWCSDCHGVLGLAKTGPLKGSRISPAVLRIELNGIMAIADCTDEAISGWRAEPWN